METNRFREMFQFLKVETLEVNHIITLQMTPVSKLVKTLQIKNMQRQRSMLRSRLALLGTKVFNYHGKLSTQIAAASELIHVSFLFHDYLCDHINYQLQKNETAILLGDFISSRAIEMIVEANVDLITRIYSDTINIISEGHIIKTHYYDKPEITEEKYMSIINRNYVSLFSACSQLGAILALSKDKEIEMMGKFGEHLGISYCLLKDYNNCITHTSTCKLTYPLIYALNHTSEKNSQIIANIISNFKNKRPNKEELEFVNSVLNETNALTFTVQKAQQHIHAAIECLHAIPTIQNRNLLIDFTNSIDQFCH